MKEFYYSVKKDNYFEINCCKDMIGAEIYIETFSIAYINDLDDSLKICDFLNDKKINNEYDFFIKYAPDPFSDYPYFLYYYEDERLFFCGTINHLHIDEFIQKTVMVR